MAPEVCGTSQPAVKTASQTTPADRRCTCRPESEGAAGRTGDGAETGRHHVHRERRERGGDGATEPGVPTDAHVAGRGGRAADHKRWPRTKSEVRALVRSVKKRKGRRAAAKAVARLLKHLRRQRRVRHADGRWSKRQASFLSFVRGRARHLRKACHERGEEQ